MDDLSRLHSEGRNNLEQTFLAKLDSIDEFTRLAIRVDEALDSYIKENGEAPFEIEFLDDITAIIPEPFPFLVRLHTITLMLTATLRDLHSEGRLDRNVIGFIANRGIYSSTPDYLNPDQQLQASPILTSLVSEALIEHIPEELFTELIRPIREIVETDTPQKIISSLSRVTQNRNNPEEKLASIVEYIKFAKGNSSISFTELSSFSDAILKGVFQKMSLTMTNAEATVKDLYKNIIVLIAAAQSSTNLAILQGKINLENLNKE